MVNCNCFLDRCGKKISNEQRIKIYNKIESIVSYEPRVGIFGKTGAGKSSLCNALFGQQICKISDVEACTRRQQEITLNISNKKGIKVIDVPGVGENTDRDVEYGKLYSNLMPSLDVILWVLKADERAYASDEKIYKKIVKPFLDNGKPFFFVLNQSDKVEPFREWNEQKHEPGPNQFVNIDRKVQYVADCFSIPASKIVPVSANEQYNMIKLVDEIVYALPQEKQFSMFTNVNKKFRSAQTTENVKESLWKVIFNAIGNVIDSIDDGISGVKEKVEDILDDFVDWLFKKK